MKTQVFDYNLPPELIAQEPVYPRDSSRLMVVRPPAAGAAPDPPGPPAASTAAPATAGAAALAGAAAPPPAAGLEHAIFRDLPSYLNAGDLLVLNRTKVIRARLFGRKAGGGGRVEVLLLRPAARPAADASSGAGGAAADSTPAPSEAHAAAGGSASPSGAAYASAGPAPPSSEVHAAAGGSAPPSSAAHASAGPAPPSSEVHAAAAPAPPLAEWGDETVWEALVRPGRRIPPGTELVFGEPIGVAGRGVASAPAGPPPVPPTAAGGSGAARLTARVIDRTPAGGRIIAFYPSRPGDSFADLVEVLGQVPLPPYITRPLGDPDRYQTIYAATKGSVAAPTAGLHFTPAVLEALDRRGVERAFVTLHIGLDTFRPVREENVEDHPMHSEWFEVPPETAAAVTRCRERGGRVVACGTTVVRTLEAAADPGRPGLVRPLAGETRLFIYPGYDFQVVDLILTNFHLPRSTLLMLVCAFGGTERMMAAYKEAIRNRYRFYSFGDAMLIYPAEAAGRRPGPAPVPARPTGLRPDHPPAAGADGGKEVTP